MLFGGLGLVTLDVAVRELKRKTEQEAERRRRIAEPEEEEKSASKEGTLATTLALR